MADDENAGTGEGGGWLLFCGLGLFWTLASGCLFSLILLASAGVIGVDRGSAEGPPLLMLGVMLAMFSPGPAMIFFGLKGHRAQSAARALRTRFPGKPWKWDPRWNTGVIPANAAREAFWAWYAAVALALFLAPAALQLVVLQPDWRALVLLPFALVDAFLFRLASRRTRSARSYGALGLALSQLPLQPGAPFTARLEVPAALDGDATLRLICRRSVTHGRGKHRTHHVETEFEATSAAAIVASGRSSIIRGALTLPPGPVGPALTWHLEVKAAGLDEAFELPVFPATEVERFAA